LRAGSSPPPRFIEMTFDGADYRPYTAAKMMASTRGEGAVNFRPANFKTAVAIRGRL